MEAGVIGGPHKVFTEIEAKRYNTKSFIRNQYALFRGGYQVDLDISVLQIQESKNYLILDEEINGALTVSVKGEQSEKNSFIIRSQKQFQMVESAGNEISYRCSSCRECKDCKNHENIETSVYEKKLIRT